MAVALHLHGVELFINLSPGLFVVYCTSFAPDNALRFQVLDDVLFEVILQFAIDFPLHLVLLFVVLQLSAVDLGHLHLIKKVAVHIG